MKNEPTEKLLIEASKKLEKYKTDLLLNKVSQKLEKHKTDAFLKEVIEKLNKIVKKKERKKAKSSPREFIKKKMKYKVDKELKKMKSLGKTKQTGTGTEQEFDEKIQADFNEILEMKKKGIDLKNDSTKLKRGAIVKNWIRTHKKFLSDEQLELLGVDRDVKSKLTRLKNQNEKELNDLSKKENLSEDEKKKIQALLNNKKMITNTIKKTK
jgi:hypothetical protein